MMAELAMVEKPVLLKLDFGCGRTPREGFEGVDQYAFDGKVAHVLDIRHTPWPWEDNSVAEAHASHFVEHLTAWERVAFCNELYRVLIPGGSCQIIVPHWNSPRAYGDPSHHWPPVSEFWFLYLNKAWRQANTPHLEQSVNPQGFNCDFNYSYGWSLNSNLAHRSEDFRRFAIENYKDACQDIIATLTKL